MRFSSRISAFLAAAAPWACTTDLPAPDLYVTASATTGSTGPVGDLMVDCGTPPAGAVGANYSHALTVSGGAGGYSWTATGLDPLLMDGAAGSIYGVPTVEGTITADVTVMDSMGAVGMTTCTIAVGPHIDAEIPPASPLPCVVGGQTFGQYVAPNTGDGSPITCTVLTGEGNGKLPAGITVNPTTCAIEGTITETTYGTWVWMVEGDQNGAKAYLPYCATNDQQEPNSYDITVHHGGDTMTNKALVPGRGGFTTGQPPSWGADTGTDPVFEIRDPVCGNPCYYGFSFSYNASPFDALSLENDAMLMAAGSNEGFSHHMTASSPTGVAATFDDRPWILNTRLTYCIVNTMQSDCLNMELANNSRGNLEFAIVMFPQ